MRVLFVSKPVMPPWNDGSKNLVRDVVTHLSDLKATVMVAPGAPDLGADVTREPVYGLAGRFAPGANTLVMNRLLFGPPLDHWVFVFAPNAASSTAARVAIAAQRARGWKGKVVQVVASRPKDFGAARGILFGDRVVTMSAWTKDRLIEGGIAADRIAVIPPCTSPPRVASREEIAELRAAHGLGDGPIVLYPGDLEFSTGARTVARAASEILRRVPGARIVFACRPKTERARDVEAELREILTPVAPWITFLGEVPDMARVLAAASVVVFPVDDLYGKVDLPIVLLEALALGKRAIVADGGPLPELGAVTVVPPRDPDALAEATCRLLEADESVDAPRSRAAYDARYRPELVATQYEALFR